MSDALDIVQGMCTETPIYHNENKEWWFTWFAQACKGLKLDVVPWKVFNLNLPWKSLQLIKCIVFGNHGYNDIISPVMFENIKGKTPVHNWFVY